MREARQPGPRQAFERLRAELKVQGETPTGVGLDVPHWLRRLEQEVHRVHAVHSSVAVLAESLFRIAAVQLSFEALEEQVGEWEPGDKSGENT